MRMPKLINLLLLLPSISFATPPILLNHEQYDGAKYKLSYPSGVLIRGSTRAPVGSSRVYVETKGKGEFEYTISNYNGANVICTITKQVCMDNLEGCVNQIDTYELAKNTRLHKKESMIVKIRYQTTGTKWTSASLYFEGCGNRNDTVWSRGQIEVRG